MCDNLIKCKICIIIIITIFYKIIHLLIKFIISTISLSNLSISSDDCLYYYVGATARLVEHLNRSIYVLDDLCVQRCGVLARACECRRYFCD